MKATTPCTALEPPNVSHKISVFLLEIFLGTGLLYYFIIPLAGLFAVIRGLTLE